MLGWGPGWGCPTPPVPNPFPLYPPCKQILGLFYEARDPAALERLQASKQRRVKEQPGGVATVPAAAPAAAAPAATPQPPPAGGDSSENCPESNESKPEEALPPPARARLSGRILRAFELRYVVAVIRHAFSCPHTMVRSPSHTCLNSPALCTGWSRSGPATVSFSRRFHFLRAGTHLQGGGLPALFPVSSCTPAPLPITRACILPLLRAGIDLLKQPGPGGEDQPGRGTRAAQLTRLLHVLPKTPSISVLFNPTHATVGPLLRKYPESELPGCVFFDGASWSIPVSRLRLVPVRDPDPAVSCRELDFSTRGRQSFRPAPATASPSGGRIRCVDPAVFVTARKGCFALVAVPPKGEWAPESSLWYGDPGENIVACGHDARYVLPQDLYTPRQNWDVGKTPEVLTAERALGQHQARAWTVAGHWDYARVRALVRASPCACALARLPPPPSPACLHVEHTA